MALREKEKARRATKEGHLALFLSKIKNRAKNQNIPFDLDLEFLTSIATDECPVFKTPFTWGHGKGRHPYRPSLDKVVPELGYVKYNVVFISYKANAIKQDITEKELYAVADWLHDKRKEVLNAYEKQPSSVPTGHYPRSEEHTKHGAVLATGAGEDNYYPHHNSGAVRGENTDHRAQESGGDSVAHRNKKVEPSPALTRIENNGEPDAEIVRLEFGSGHLFD
jgi:hypothetical protein